MGKEYFVYGFPADITGEVEQKVTQELGPGDDTEFTDPGFPSGKAKMWLGEKALCITLYYQPPALHGSEVEESSNLGRYFEDLSVRYQTQ